ncbi:MULTISPECIES: hypothetical protein [unclassified Streptomyces]|nr:MULTISPECIES: hypothetical protein [unclassified Streptomyces]
MALQTSISIGELKKRNDASQAAREAEKTGSATSGQQQKGR